jgi:DNA-binding transcriptional LysR family regulator
MSDLADYATFIAILDTGSLTAAARRTGRSLQAVSRALAELEAELGAQLIHRTTRRLQATPAGAAFAERIRRALADIEAARESARHEGESPSGKLRVAAPVLLGATCLTPMTASFIQRWPQIEVELVLSERKADLVADQLDLAVRLGELPDSSLRARKLADMRRVFFASPAWLQRHGRPGHPQALSGLPCVLRTTGADRKQWPATVDGEVRHIKVHGAFSVNDAAAANEAVANGLGAGLAPFWQVKRMLDEGRVETILRGFEPPPVAIQAAWPSGGALPARTRLFIDHLVIQFNAMQW